MACTQASPQDSGYGRKLFSDSQDGIVQAWLRSSWQPLLVNASVVLDTNPLKGSATVTTEMYRREQINK